MEGESSMRISEELGLNLTIEEELDLVEMLIDDNFEHIGEIVQEYMEYREFGEEDFYEPTTRIKRYIQ